MGFDGRGLGGLGIHEEVGFSIHSSCRLYTHPPSSALKLSKKLLETQRNSVELWGSHARLERLRSKFDEAQKVYTMALQLPTNSRGALLYDAAEFAWLRGNNASAAQIVARALGVEGSIEGVGLLRAKRALHAQLDLQQVGSLEWGAWVKTRCLLELLTTSVDPVEHCLALFDILVGDVPPRSRPHETVTVASCVMLYHHSVTLQTTTQPAILRNRVQKSLELYPENTILLALFLEGEKGQGVWGRVRSLLDGDVQEKSISRIMWEVWAEGWEIGRWEPERVRTKLEKAVSSERCVTHTERHGDYTDLSQVCKRLPFCGGSTLPSKSGSVNWVVPRTCFAGRLCSARG
jgi:tetratricopeptide (TPR) repeat protein